VIVGAPAAPGGRPRFSGAVLCGDKALIPVHGRALAVRVAGAIADAAATRVVAVGGDLPALRSRGLTAIPDEGAPGAGPLAGLVTALAHAEEAIVFVAACDLVDPSADAVAATVGALGAGDADVAVPQVGARRQWMHAAWRRRAEMPLRAALGAGEKAVHAAVAAGGLRVVEVALDPGAVADADRPPDLPGV
jgi:molybdopterin-guanine dinucleotide biosynthesis protein A